MLNRYFVIMLFEGEQVERRVALRRLVQGGLTLLGGNALACSEPQVCSSGIFLEGRKPIDVFPGKLVSDALYLTDPSDPLLEGMYVSAIEPGTLLNRNDFTDANSYKSRLQMAAIFSLQRDNSLLIVAGGIKIPQEGRESTFSYTQRINVNSCNISAFGWRKGTVTEVLWNNRRPADLKLK